MSAPVAQPEPQSPLRRRVAVLLKAEMDESGCGYREMAAALEMSTQTVYAIRHSEPVRDKTLLKCLEWIGASGGPWTSVVRAIEDLPDLPPASRDLIAKIAFAAYSELR